MYPMKRTHILSTAIAALLLSMIVVRTTAHAEGEPPTPKIANAVGEVRVINGSVKIQSAATRQWADLQVRQKVYLGDVVKTLGGGQTRIELIDKSTLNMGQNSQVKIRNVTVMKEARNTMIQLIVGKIREIGRAHV